MGRPFGSKNRQPGDEGPSPQHLQMKLSQNDIALLHRAMELLNEQLHREGSTDGDELMKRLQKMHDLIF